MSSWRGKRILVTCGPTREFLDPVRFLTNASSGRMGFEVAAEARRRGAAVTVVSGPVFLPPPAGVTVVRVTTARQMLAAALAAARRAHAVVAAAAVGDWRFSRISRRKIKRSARALRLTLVPNPDIIREISRRARKASRPPVLVGFALETGRAEAAARGKLERKGLDLVVANGPESLSADRVRASFVGRGWTRRLGPLPKRALARALCGEIERLWHAKNFKT